LNILAAWTRLFSGGEIMLGATEIGLRVHDEWNREPRRQRFFRKEGKDDLDGFYAWSGPDPCDPMEGVESGLDVGDGDIAARGDGDLLLDRSRRALAERRLSRADCGRSVSAAGSPNQDGLVGGNRGNRHEQDCDWKKPHISLAGCLSKWLQSNTALLRIASLPGNDSNVSAAHVCEKNA
jgi:hypothetical protein